MNNYSVFGFGRRLCPGAHIAERSLNIIVVRIGWACTINKSIDQATGKEITPPEYDCEHCIALRISTLANHVRADVRGMNTEPHEFPFDLQCRSPERWKVLEEEAQKATDVLNQPMI